MKEFIVSYESGPSYGGYVTGRFSADGKHLGRSIVSTIAMGYVITGVRLKEDDE